MGMAIGDNGSGKQPKPVVNVTPLVDVALVVLIIFMVVTPMMTKTFWLNLPKKETTDKEPAKKTSEADKPLVMTIDSKGIIRVNKTALALEEIVERLPRMLAAKKRPVLYFDAADQVPYGKAVEAMDQARIGGARSIAIVTEKIVH